jgi:MFS transporter, FHS family, glucose/mannose:H+ symporter
MSQKLTWLAYLSNLTVGATLSLAGVTTPEIAAQFQVDTYKIGYAVTLFTTGYSLAVYLNGFALDRINIKKELACALLGMLIAVVGITKAPSLLIYTLFMSFYGLSVGILYSISYYNVAALYDGNERASKLSYTSFGFSVGSLLAPFLAGLALQKRVNWGDTYLSMIGLIALLLLFAYRLNFNHLHRNAHRETAGTAKWNAAVYTNALAIFFYVAAESVVSYWVVSYSHAIIGLEIGAASFTLAIFWAFIALGRLSAGLITRQVAANHYILASSLSGILALISFLLWADRMEYAYLLIAFVGASFSSMFALLLSFGIAQINYMSSKLMSLYMAAGAVGNIAGLFFSSYVNQHFGLPQTLLTSIVALATVFCLTWLTTYLARQRQRKAGRSDG